ncbi:hypothetical protein EWM64_g9230 [Hericium alpestre]|uniref:Histone H1 n=1 Tax=Hericium alpestre TaxID=135208 RepID=A0A4Y9ZJ99_9AGAM|nr:hypothetical protein EWM64_g9230 [Hericium alpestre]
MSAAKKSTTAKSSKKTAAKSVPAHPTWTDMIKECITDHPEDARGGVSRPQIKKYVEDKYKLEIGNAQTTQLSKAIAVGAEKGVFVLPKGPSGRVKLPPRAKAAESSAAKENKPATKATKAAAAKPKAAKAATAKATKPTKPAAKKAAVKTAAKATAVKAAAAKKAPAPKAGIKPAAKPTAAKKPLAKKTAAPAKKVIAGRKPAAEKKKTTAISRRGAAKKAVTGTTTATKAKTAARKPPAKRTTATSARSSGKRDTLLLHARWAWRGLVDAFRWDVVLRIVASDSEIRANVLKSLVLNSISLLSIYVFDIILHPLAKDQPQKWLHRNVGWFYQASWCTLLAKRTYTLRHGRASSFVGPTTTTAPNAYIAFLTSLANSAYRGVMIVTSVVLSFALGYVPLVGPSAEFGFLCWVDAFIWIARGLSLSRRVRHLEERWAYYFMFGLPSATLCMWGSTLANAALFALVFPAYIIMAMHAHPVPHDPYNPVPPPPDAAQHTITHPSPYVPIRVPVFQPVIFINDCIVRVLSLGTRWPAGAAHRKPWVESAESVEEGDAEEVELRAYGARERRGLRRKRD